MRDNLFSMKEWRSETGNKIRLLRENHPKRYTRKSLMRLFKNEYPIDISEGQLEKIERGASFPGYRLLRCFCDFFSVDYDFLLASFQDKDKNPDLWQYPEFQFFQSTMRKRGISDDSIIYHLRQMARILGEFAVEVQG